MEKLGRLGAFLVDCQLPLAVSAAVTSHSHSFAFFQNRVINLSSVTTEIQTGTLTAFGNVDDISSSSVGKGHKVFL